MEIVFAIGIVLFIVFGPWILLARTNSRRKRDRDEDKARWTDLTSRIHALENQVRELRSQPSIGNTIETVSKATVFGPPVPTQSPVSTSVPPPVPAEFQPSASEITAREWIDRERLETTPAKSQADYVHDTVSASGSSSTSTPPPPIPPAFHPVESGPSLFDRFKSALDIEEMLGTNWLNKLGIALLVLGVAFFLAYQLKTLGPWGKVMVGLVTAGVMLGAGIWFERAERYRILARAGVGGGWALLFFTIYAMYHVDAARVLTSQPLDLVLMLIVATAMVGHTLRYRSQVVTGLAFLLAFLTVAISHSNVYSLSAGAVLAAALVVIIGRMQWFELEIFGILASYLNHYLWLRPIIEPMQGHRHPFPEFPASAGILTLYWLIFRLSYVFRRPDKESQERVSTAAALLNTGLLLALFKYQSTHPEWAFWALLAIGAIEVLLGQLPITRWRRTAVIVLSTLGVVLLIAAFPFRYSGTRLSVLWLAEAEALLLIGVWAREVVFRRLGMIASIVVAGQMLCFDAAEMMGRRMDGADLRSDFALSVIFLVAAAVFYGNAHWVLRRWANLFAHEFDRIVMRRLSYVGAVMLMTGSWIAFPEAWTAVAWCALGLAMAIAARKLAEPVLRYQSIFAAAAAVFRVLIINLNATDEFHGITLRLSTVGAVAILLYVSSRWVLHPDATEGARHGPLEVIEWLAGEAYTWSASFLLALLAWYELRPVGVADAWAVVGLLLLELGLTRKRVSLRLQGYGALVAGFLRIFIVNLNADGSPGQISPRFYSIVPIALAFYYAYWRLRDATDDLAKREQWIRPAAICCWLGTITIAALMRFELEADWVAAAWAALAFALLALAWRSGQRVFIYQGLLITFAVLFRTGLHNFYERSYFPAPAWESRWITSGAAILLLLATLPITFKIRRKGESGEEHGLVRILQALERRPEQLFFFAAIGLLTVLLAIEMRHGMVTLSWGLEGVAVFMLALWLGERSFRLTGLGLLLLCVGKILVQDVWRLNPRDRYLTFIVLGGALLLVSFLYTRNKEKLRQYL